jgi:hypothetical protein
METNLEHLTDDELILEIVSILDDLEKQIASQLILILILVVYNAISFYYNSINFAWVLTQILGWGTYLYHDRKYFRKRKVFKFYREEMIKREMI